MSVCWIYAAYHTVSTLVSWARCVHLQSKESSRYATFALRLSIKTIGVLSVPLFACGLGELIYLYSKDDFIFEREIDMLQKCYPIQFMLNVVNEKISDVATPLRELLKAAINSNTKDKLIFILSADDEVVYNASHTLYLSGIEEKQIKIHFLK